MIVGFTLCQHPKPPHPSLLTNSKLRGCQVGHTKTKTFDYQSSISVILQGLTLYQSSYPLSSDPTPRHPPFSYWRPVSAHLETGHSPLGSSSGSICSRSLTYDSGPFTARNELHAWINSYGVLLTNLPTAKPGKCKYKEPKMVMG